MVGAEVSLNPDKYRTITTFSHSSVPFRVKQIKKQNKTIARFLKKKVRRLLLRLWFHYSVGIEISGFFLLPNLQLRFRFTSSINLPVCISGSPILLLDTVVL